MRKRALVPGVLQVTSAPKLSLALAIQGEPRRHPDALVVVDLRAGAVSKVIRPRDFQARVPVSFSLATCSPDGAYVFTCGPLGHLLRFRLQGGDLTLVDSSERIGSNPGGIAVSPDSKFVCMPSGGGNRVNAPGHPDVPPYSTYIYSIKTLQTPALAINQGAYPRAVAFDPRTGKIYSQNHDHQLLVFGPQGIRERQFQLGGRGESTWQLLAHPEGDRVLVLTDAKVYSVQLAP